VFQVPSTPIAESEHPTGSLVLDVCTPADGVSRLSFQRQPSASGNYRNDSIVDALGRIEHLSKLELKTLVQQCRRSGVFHPFERPLPNLAYNQFVAEALSSLCMTRALVVRAAQDIGCMPRASAVFGGDAGATCGIEPRRGSAIGFLPSDRRIILEMIQSHVFEETHALLHTILSDKDYWISREWTDAQTAAVDDILRRCGELAHTLPFVAAELEDYKASSVRRMGAAAIGGMTPMSLRHVPDEVLPGLFVSSYHTAMSDALMKAHRIEAVVSCVGDLFRPRTPDENTNSGLVTFVTVPDVSATRFGQSPGVTSGVSSGGSLSKLILSGMLVHEDDEGTTNDVVTYKCHEGVLYCNFELRDKDTFRIDRSFAAASLFVREQFVNQGHRVMFVCGVGASRAPTVCAACLCDIFGLAPPAALRLIKSVRPQVKPNDAFLLHLLRCYGSELLPRN
jgi:hypothetical protein